MSSGGLVSTIAGNGGFSFNPDGSDPTLGGLRITTADFVTASGDLLFSEEAVGSIRRIIAASPTPTASPSSSPYCFPSLFRDLPRMDLVGTLVGTAFTPGAPTLVSSLAACRQACCDAPACDGFSFGTGDASFVSGGAASCFLYVNITQLIPSSVVSSGIYESTL